VLRRITSGLSTLRVALERRSHERDSSAEITEHELRADADDAKARALQLAVAARVRAPLVPVNGTIDFDDEVDARRAEVRDEEPRDWHLTAKRHAELPSLERGPERRLRLGEPRAMLPSKELEPSCGFRNE
jgi:hypothetical protein